MTTPSQTLPDLLTAQETAAMLRVKPECLEASRGRGKSKIPFVRVGRLIRYRRADVLEFIERNTQAVAP